MYVIQADMHNSLFGSSSWSFVGVPIRKDDTEVMVLVWKCEKFSNEGKNFFNSS